MMTTKPIYKINWEKAFGDSYNYGSTIQFLEDSVEFSNPLMSPNLAIMTWYSKRHFANDRAFPTLPILVQGHEYTIKMDYNVQTVNGAYWVVNFYGTNNEQIDHLNFDDLEGSFFYPSDATHYEVSIMNIGHQKINFKNFILIDHAVATRVAISVNDKFNFVSIKPLHEHDKVLKIIFSQVNVATETYQLNSLDENIMFWRLNNFDANKLNDLQILQSIREWWHLLVQDDEHLSLSVLEHILFENNSGLTNHALQHTLKDQVDTALKLDESSLLERELYQIANQLQKNPWLK
ncbi:accessory Sec system protein Asp3 [Periweissella fabalis]|uniref:Accessory Sec system protein Asp3 n=1 Tax=Periweissella fabalis TaxID=1070421 RepID=A0A7X6N2Z7_9LACO|nr:accessory Sec system protein Asp3 [Periweissella fabalis]MCM0599493.1 accessory Sec system protein Asp3 [Periweissella fabalis]NKZ23772.1 accessory Sec system protein Asp3 [Periweissella fabalis]